MSEAEVREIFSDEAFTNSLLALDTPEEVQSALHDKGLDLSLGEIATIRNSVLTAAEQGGELSEEQLETVSGGILISGVIGFIIALAVGAAAGGLNGSGTRW
jgi:ribose/xylose/arabinose/galactoside ABC-type transport system permease subunit